MKINISAAIRTTLAVLAVSAIGTTNVAAETGDTAVVPGTAEEFLKGALQASQVELQAAKLAQEKGQHQAVRHLGELIAKDQRQIQNKLHEIAKSRNANASQELQAEHQQQMQKLRHASSSEFDQVFVRQMISDHKRDLTMLKHCSGKFSDDSQIAELIREHRSTVNRHLESAQNAARILGIRTEGVAQGGGATTESGESASKDAPTREGDGEVLGLPISNNDGTILGVVPAPSRKVEAGNQSESYVAEELADGKVKKGVENISQADQDTVVAPSTAEREKAASKVVRD